MKSIQTRLLAAIALIVVISGLAISQSIIHHYRISVHENATAQAKNTAQNLALNAADKILLNDIIALQRLLNDRMKNDEAVAYLFVIHQGEILAHTFPDGVPAQLVRPHDADNQASRENPASPDIQKIQSETGERFLDVTRPISDGRAGILRLGYAEAPFEQQVKQLWIQASIMTLAFLFIALLIGLGLIRQITRPIVRLTDAVSNVDEDHIETDVPFGTDDESGRLAAAFNNMLARLKDYTNRLEESKKALEDKNRELKRAHRQTRSLYEITRGTGALAGLNDICRYLNAQIREIVSCNNTAFILFTAGNEPPVVFSGGSIRTVDATLIEKIREIVNIPDKYRFYNASDVEPNIAEFKNAVKVGVVPFYHEERLAGALYTECTATCACGETDLEALKIIMDQSSGAIQRALVQENELAGLKKQIEHGTGYAGLIGKNPKMQDLYKLIEDVAPADANVLIEGESGTGKEMVARAIHEKSPRKNNPFVVINCSAYPATLLESELFGHEKGAFTGAVRQKAGRFEQANGGTIFLDEIGEIPLQAQVKLLRVVQNRKFERIGGDTTISVDIRILAATNKELLQAVKTGDFREDLFYRLNVIPMHLPPLRNRKNDIPYLARHFLSRFNEIQGKFVKDFNTETMRRLLEYSWPGNVRELENTVEHAVVLAREDRIMPTDLPSFLTNGAFTEGDAARKPDKTLETQEKQHLIEMLNECGWNKKETARRLGISRSTLYVKLKRFQIKNPA